MTCGHLPPEQHQTSPLTMPPFHLIPVYSRLSATPALLLALTTTWGFRGAQPVLTCPSRGSPPIPWGRVPGIQLQQNPPWMQEKETPGSQKWHFLRVREGLEIISVLGRTAHLAHSERIPARGKRAALHSHGWISMRIPVLS